MEQLNEEGTKKGQNGKKSHIKEVGRGNEQSVSSFKAGLGCYPPVISSHPVPGGVALLQTCLTSELCAAPCPQTDI